MPVDRESGSSFANHGAGLLGYSTGNSDQNIGHSPLNLSVSDSMFIGE